MKRTNLLTIVMYHYVRDLVNSRFPEIKGLSTENFRKQLDYFQQHYTFVRMEECLHALQTGENLPENAILLTFDDGYLDHFINVFPILSEKGIQGSFFPSAKVVLENCVLDVNKIHFILASVNDKKKLLESVCEQIHYYQSEYQLKLPQDYIASIHQESRYDTKETILIKCLLQRDLPFEARMRITDDLFKKYINISETIFSKELYMNIDQIKMMKRDGMFIGSHGYDHVWLNTLSPENQEKEIDLSLDFLRTLDVDTHNWVMCYPYGEYNNSLIEILRNKNCKLGLTTNVDIANLALENAFTMPRLDTNDFPVSAKQSISHWTLKITQHAMGELF